MASSKSVTINLNVEASMSRSFDASTIGGVKVEDDFASAFGVTMAKIDASAMTPQSAAGGDDSYSVHPKTPLLAPSTATTGGLKRKENFKTPNPTKTARRRPPVRAQGALAAAGVFATPAAAPTLKYASRKNSGKVETVMNNMITDAVARGDGTDAFMGAGSSQKVALVATPLAAAAAKAPKLEAGAVRFMHTTAAQKANFLERRVLAMGKRLRAAHKLPEFSPLGVPSQSTVVVCGRVCCECEPAAIGSGVAALEARLDAGSVMLEGSRALSSGARVSVDLSNLPAYSLFPGQIVAISGVDVTGARLVAQALYTGAAPPRAAAVAAAAAAAAGAAAPIRAEQKQPLRVWSAAGPFTTTDNLNFVPLHDFVTLAAEVRETPDVIVLSGPFIPASHPQLKAGACVLNNDGENVELSHFELFRLKVLNVIQDLLDEKPNMKIVLVPSLDDVIADHVFPQAPFAHTEAQIACKAESLGLEDLATSGETDAERRILVVPNPGSFTVGGVRFAAITNDVLMHFVKQDTSMFPNAKLRPERMVRLARHMLQQRSMYPLFPAPKKAQLDARLLEHASLHIRPDIILANSALRYFAKDVDGVAVVNPASLAKFATGGTYAKIYIAPTPKISASALATGIAGEEAPVAARTRVEIVRI